MALTDANTFGDAVITEAGALAEFSAYPLLKPAVRYGAAYAYAAYLKGHYGRSPELSAKMFGVRAMDVLDNLVLSRTSDLLSEAGWPNRPAGRGTIQAALETVFATYAS